MSCKRITRAAGAQLGLQPRDPAFPPCPFPPGTSLGNWHPMHPCKPPCFYSSCPHKPKAQPITGCTSRFVWLTSRRQLHVGRRHALYPSCIAPLTITTTKPFTTQGCAANMRLANRRGGVRISLNWRLWEVLGMPCVQSPELPAVRWCRRPVPSCAGRRLTTGSALTGAWGRSQRGLPAHGKGARCG
jgi:hypothetical protein